MILEDKVRIGFGKSSETEQGQEEKPKSWKLEKVKEGLKE